MRAHVFDTDGVASAADLAEAFAAAPLLENVEAVLDDIHAHGERACPITMSPDYFADLLLPLGGDDLRVAYEHARRYIDRTAA